MPTYEPSDRDEQDTTRHMTDEHPVMRAYHRIIRFFKNLLP